MKRHLTPLLALVLAGSLCHAEEPATASAGSSLQSLSLEVDALAGSQNVVAPVASSRSDDETTAVSAEPDMATMYAKAMSVQRANRLARYNHAVRLVRAERDTVLADADRFFSERQKDDAQEAITGFIPTQDLTSNTSSLDAAGMSHAFPIVAENGTLANTPEPSTWALFGLGAGLLIFVLPGRGGRATPKND